jgi:hypothetical protein
MVQHANDVTGANQAVAVEISDFVGIRGKTVPV